MPVFHKALLLFNPVSGAHLEFRTATMRRIAEIFRRAGVEVVVEATQARDSAGPPGACGHQRRLRRGVCLRRRWHGLRGSAGRGRKHGDDGRDSAWHRQRAGPRPGTGGTAGAGGGADPRLHAAEDFAGTHPDGGAFAIFHRGGRSGSSRRIALPRQRPGETAGRISGLLLARSAAAIPPRLCALSGGDHHQRRRRRSRRTALELVAMRVRSFGGPLRHWRPGSSLLSPDLRLVLLRNPSRAHMLRYTLAGADRPGSL